MSELSLSLSYKRDSNSFVLNETGTADGWVPAPVSVSPESLTVLNTNQLLEKFGGSNQSRIYVDGTNPSSTDVRNNSGNSPLRPFRTLQRALLEVSRRSFKLGSDNDLYEKTTIIVAPGEYEIYNGPANSVDEFTTFNRYQDASRLILKNTDWIIDGAYNAMSTDFRAELVSENEDDNVKQKLIFFLNALYNDLSRGNNQRTINEALEMIIRSSESSCEDSPSYFASYYVDSNLRNQYVNALGVMKTRAVAAMRNLGGIYVDNTISPELDINGNSVDPPCADVADTIHTLLDYLIDTLDCDIDPRNIVLTSKGAEASVFPPDYEPPLTFYQKFNSNQQSGVILPRGVSIIGEDLRKVTFRPNYVPPKDGSEGRGSIFRMTGGNFFSGFTIKDKQGLEESHHNLSSFEFCTPIDLSDYYTKVNTSFRDYSIYYHAINSAYLLDKNREWITKKSLETFFSAAINERFYNILQEETPLFVSALVRDLLTQSQTAVQEYSERFRLAHIYSLEISGSLQEDINSALSLYENYFQRVIIYVQQSYLNQANITEGGYQDNRIKQSSDTTAVYNQETIVGRYADITAAVYTYRDIFLAIINGQPLPTYEIATRFEASDIEAITEETSIVTDPISKPNSVVGASPYIFSASVRSEYGMCGVDADGSKVNGLKSILVAQFTIISLQKDSAAFTTLDAIGEVAGRYIGSKYTDKTDYRHYGYKISNGAYAQLVSCFCIGPALHYMTESGGEVSISNSTSNFGDISLYSTGANSTPYPQDTGHRIYGIKKPAPINTVVRNFILGYVSSTSLENQTQQIGTITLNSVAELSGYNVTNPSSPTKVYVRVNQIVPTVETIIISAEIISIQTNEQNKSVITVKFINDYNTYWDNNTDSSNYKPGLIGGALYFERYVDTRPDDDKLYKFLVQVPNPTVNSPKRAPVVNYILNKPVLWTPERITTRLWYDFSDESTITLNGSNISGVADKSSSGINLSQPNTANQPQYYTAGINGRNTYYVQDANRTLPLVTPLAFNYTIENIFVVLKAPVVSNYNIIVTRNSLDPTDTPAPYAGRPGISNMNLYWGGDRVSSYTISDETGIFQWGYNNTNASVVMNKNGGVPDVVVGHFSIPGDSIWTNIGGLPEISLQVPDLFHYGEIIFTADVTTDIRQRIEGYLAHKWGLVDYLPVTHPYKNSPPMSFLSSESFGSNWNSVFNRGNLFSLAEIKKHTSEPDFGNNEYDPNDGELYECTFVSAYSNQSGQIEYYQDLIRSSSLDTVLDKDPDPNTYLSDLNSLDHKSRSVTRQILGMLLGYETSEQFASLDSSLDIDPLSRIHALDSVQEIDFHKPSIIRASGQTWEYCGYKNYSTALPALQTRNLGEGIENEQDRSRFLFSKIQTQVYAGRVYATGMDEEGNQYVGNTILDIKTGEETKVNLGSNVGGEVEVIANFNTLTTRLLKVQEKADIFDLQVTNDLTIGGSLTATEPVYLQDITSEGSVTIEQSLEVDGFTDLAGFLFYKDSNNKPTLSLSEENQIQSNIVLNNNPVLSAESGLTLSVGTTTVLGYDNLTEQVELNTHSLSIANSLVLEERSASDINLNVNSLSISGSDVITENGGTVSASLNEIDTNVITAPDGIIISAGTDSDLNNTKLLEVDGSGNIIFNRIAGQLSYVTTTIVSDTAPTIRPDNTTLLEGDIWVQLSDPTRHFIYYKDDSNTPVEYFWVQL